MATRCNACGTQCPDRFRFCGECGAPLPISTPVADTPAKPEASSPEGGGERRQLTVVFCDMVGSTELANRLDPEEWREIMRAYQDKCAEVATALGGHVARYIGDALKVYFGYPQAHEDHAARALRTALSLVDAMPALSSRFPALREPLRIRVGVHTGLAVTGEIAGEKYGAIGETPNIASRLQTMAEPDSVFTSNVTRRLAEGLFDFEDRGAQSLKGIAQPMSVFRVLRTRKADDRMDARAVAELTPLTGRERELGLLRDRWERAKNGHGQVVLISGEAGIGKTRLLHALRETIDPAGCRWLVCRCYPHTQASALFPVIQLIQGEIGFASEDSPARRLEKLKQSLAADGQTGAEVLSVLASLLSLPVPGDDALAGQSPDAKKQKTLQVLVGWFLAIARAKPLVVVAEDLHWADPSSLELLQVVLKSLDDAAILALLTRRREGSFPLAVRANMREVGLSRLKPDDVGRIIHALTGGRRLPPEVVDQIVARTDGVPLFVEELVKMVLESGLLVEGEGQYSLSGPLPPLAIPSTLQDSLMARLDRLGDIKEVAQLAAVIGREFTCEMLCMVSGKDEESMQKSLHRLIVADLISPHTDTTYAFKHALTQEAAYHSLLKSRRQLVHRQVADALANRFPDIRQTQPELVAHHYTAAGLAELSLQHWLKAGRRAEKRTEYDEAVMHLRRGLEVLATMPESTERLRYELQFQVALGDALIAVMGYGVPQVGEAYARARDLCLQLGEEPQLGFVLGGVWVYYLIRADYVTALQLARQLMRLSEKLPIPLLAAGAHTALGITLLNLGDIETARIHLETAAEFGERDQLVLSSDLRVSALCFLANAQAALGDVQRAIESVDQAVARARDLGKPFFLANALTHSAWIRHLAGDVDGAELAANAAVALSTEQRFPYWQAWSLTIQGWVLVERGRLDEGLAQMVRSDTVSQESGSARGTTVRLAILADGYMRAGFFQEALTTLHRAQDHVERTGERFCEAELFRLRGEILLRRDAGLSLDEAEECFRMALDLGRRQGARLWTARAEASLTRRPAQLAAN